MSPGCASLDPSNSYSLVKDWPCQPCSHLEINVQLKRSNPTTFGRRTTHNMKPGPQGTCQGASQHEEQLVWNLAWMLGAPVSDGTSATESSTFWTRTVENPQKHDVWAANALDSPNVASNLHAASKRTSFPDRSMMEECKRPDIFTLPEPGIGVQCSYWTRPAKNCCHFSSPFLSISLPGLHFALETI